LGDKADPQKREGKMKETKHKKMITPRQGEQSKSKGGKMNGARMVRKVPPYCVQNDGDCWSCSLNNYGRDCVNNPIPKPKTRKSKLEKAIENFGGFKGRETINHILSFIGAELRVCLTARELGLVMRAIDKAYREGRLSCGASIIDGDAVWIESLKNMYDLDDIRKLTPVREK